jgi:hypothetical protein
LRIAIPLYNPEGLAAIQQMFDFEQFAAFLTAESVRHLDAELEDLVGMKKAGHRDTALWVARQVLDVSVEAYLHSTGNTDPVAKWRIRHLAELDDSPRHEQLRADYWRLSYPDLGALRAGEGWIAYVDEVIQFSNRVTAWAQT